MTCTHTRWQSQPDYYDDYNDLYVPQPSIEVSTTEDIDIGRFRCTQCGHVMYYTGRWRDFFEKGKPCPGSERVRRK
jgi:hypothetical protein